MALLSKFCIWLKVLNNYLLEAGDVGVTRKFHQETSWHINIYEIYKTLFVLEFLC